MASPEYLTIRQVAARTQLNAETVRLAVVRGEIRALRVGRAWRIPASALAELEQDAAS